jgi:hypothetical protein
LFVFKFWKSFRKLFLHNKKLKDLEEIHELGSKYPNKGQLAPHSANSLSCSLNLMCPSGY